MQNSVTNESGGVWQHAFKVREWSFLPQMGEKSHYNVRAH